MKKEETPIPNEDICAKCGSPLTEVITTPSGRKLQRCTSGNWDPKTKQMDGCDFVKWMPIEPEALDESCPKCGGKLLLVVTRFGKKMKRCEKGGWDKATKKATGCDYVEWINGVSEQLDELCPQCGSALVLYTTISGKKMKKCSTSGWDKKEKKATGCTYIDWIPTAK